MSKHLMCDPCFKKVGPLEELTIGGISGEGSCAYCREWLTGEAFRAAHYLRGEPDRALVLKLRRCQAEDQGGWPCNATPIVFQLTEAEVKKNDGEQAYFCKDHRTSRHVWNATETEPISHATMSPMVKNGLKQMQEQTDRSILDEMEARLKR